MSKVHKEAVDEMRAEYDFSGGVRGKYFERYKASSNIVVLDPDVSSVFPNGAAVNEALRGLAAIASKVPTPPNNALHQTKRARSGRRVS
jgi:hypothetical protein